MNDSNSAGASQIRRIQAHEAIAEEIKALGIDTVFGLMSDDSNASAVGPLLAELLGISSATGVVKAEKTAAGFKVERELEGGALEVVELLS